MYWKNDSIKYFPRGGSILCSKECDGKLEQHEEFYVEQYRE